MHYLFQTIIIYLKKNKYTHTHTHLYLANLSTSNDIALTYCIVSQMKKKIRVFPMHRSFTEILTSALWQFFSS